MYNLWREETPGIGIELKPVFKEINRLNKTLMLNGIKQAVSTGKTHPAKLPTCEKELEKSLE